MINVLICENDSRTCKVNEDIVKELSKKFGVTVNITTSVDGKKIQRKEYDIVFMDIDLGSEEGSEGNGIDIARKVLSYNKAASIIFITNHGEYALDACKLQCFGYLLKPVAYIEFEQLFAKAVIQQKAFKSRRIAEQLSIFCDRKQLIINQCDIIYIERKQRKVNIITLWNWYPSSESLNSLMQKLEKYFLKVSQGIVVNAREIESIEGNKVYMKTGQSFKIGRAYRNIKELYNSL